MSGKYDGLTYPELKAILDLKRDALKGHPITPMGTKDMFTESLNRIDAYCDEIKVLTSVMRRHSPS